ncbi:MAG: pilus assembly protein PilM [Deltaproteobacteria bacterium]|nr:pilus assembly protein PilM [Deltaproteobacteria bacterium]
MSQRVLGLDLGNRSIKAVSLNVSFKGFEFIEYIEKERSPLVDLAKELEELVGAKKLSPDLCIVAMPGEKTAVRTIVLPSKRIEQTLPFELEDQIPFKLDQIVYDYHLLSRTAENAKVLVAYSRKDDFIDLVDSMGHAGLDPKIVTVDVLAYSSLFGNMITPSSNGLDAIVDMGHEWTSVCIMNQGQPVAARALGGGGRCVTEALAKAFDLPLERAEKGKLVDGVIYTEEQEADGDSARVSETIKAALAPTVRELNQTFRSVTSELKMPLNKIYLCGGSSAIRNLDKHLSSRTGSEAALLTLDFEKQVGSGTGNRIASMAKAFSLALQGTRSGRAKPMNFRKGEYAYKGDTATLKGKLVQTAVLLGAILCLLIADTASRLYFLSTEETRVTNRLKSISKEIVGKPFTEPKKVLSIVEEEIRNGAGGGIGLPEVTALEAFREMVNRIPKDSKIVFKEVMIGDRRCRLKGKTDSLGSVSTFVDNLGAYHCFSDITRGRTGTDVAGTGMEFELGMNLVCHEIKKDKSSSKAEKMNAGKQVSPGTKATEGIKKSKILKIKATGNEKTGRMPNQEIVGSKGGKTR